MASYYKTLIICVPDNYKDSLDKVKELCQKFTGTEYKINEEREGLKHLKYPIRRSYKGFYEQGYCVIYAWRGKSSNVQELEKYLYNDDNVLRFTTFLTTKEEAHLNLNPYKSEQKKPVDILDIIYNFNNKN